MTTAPPQPKTEFDIASDTMAGALGFRVTDKHVEQLIKSPKDGSLIVRTLRPSEPWEKLLWDKLIYERVNGERAAKLSWEIYHAATGRAVANFNGMGPGVPVDDVRKERQRLRDIIDSLNNKLDSYAQGRPPAPSRD